MRATNHRYCETRRKQNKYLNAPVKPNKKVKAASVAIAVSLAIAALVVPTTTFAPDVDAFEDSRIASYALGDINEFSSVITSNCVEITTVPVTEEKKAAEVKSSDSKSETKADDKKTTSEEKNNSEKEEKATDSKKTDKSETSEASKTNEKKSESASETEKEPETEPTTVEENTTAPAPSSLIDISNPDSSYSPSMVSLSSYDRAKLERLVMGEAGSTGFIGASLVAQAIRDTMNLCGSTSIDYIISEYKYYGSTAGEPNQTVKDAVSYIFDENGSAVQHRILCFYTGTSAWHETQNFIVGYGTMRFFDFYS